jgi:CYTH domain-containing protein
MVASDGKNVTCKLTQKYTHTPGNFASVVITNTYLTELEYRIFAVLAADELRKDRYRYIVDGRQYAVDCFHGELAGLVLAEIEFATDQDLSTFRPPSFVLADVTGEEMFTGGRLCRFIAAELQDVVERTLRR